MREFIRHLFSDSNDVSMMRFMAFLCILTAIALALLGKPGYEYFLFSAFGGKLSQKFAEKKP